VYFISLLKFNGAPRNGGEHAPPATTLGLDA